MRIIWIGCALTVFSCGLFAAKETGRDKAEATLATFQPYLEAGAIKRVLPRVLSPVAKARKALKKYLVDDRQMTKTDWKSLDESLFKLTRDQRIGFLRFLVNNPELKKPIKALREFEAALRPIPPEYTDTPSKFRLAITHKLFQLSWQQQTAPPARYYVNLRKLKNNYSARNVLREFQDGADHIPTGPINRFSPRETLELFAARFAVQLAEFTPKDVEWDNTGTTPAPQNQEEASQAIQDFIVNKVGRSKDFLRSEQDVHWDDLVVSEQCKGSTHRLLIRLNAIIRFLEKGNTPRETKVFVAKFIAEEWLACSDNAILVIDQLEKLMPMNLHASRHLSSVRAIRAGLREGAPDPWATPTEDLRNWAAMAIALTKLEIAKQALLRNPTDREAREGAMWALGRYRDHLSLEFQTTGLYNSLSFHRGDPIRDFDEAMDTVWNAFNSVAHIINVMLLLPPIEDFCRQLRPDDPRLDPSDPGADFMTGLNAFYHETVTTILLGTGYFVKAPVTFEVSNA